MTDAPWCDFCDLPKNVCAHSAAAKAAEEIGPIVVVGPTIEARTDSRCSLCGDRIDEGDLIVLVDDHGWIHSRHAPQDHDGSPDDSAKMFEGIEP